MFRPDFGSPTRTVNKNQKRLGRLKRYRPQSRPYDSVIDFISRELVTQSRSKQATHSLNRMDAFRYCEFLLVKKLRSPIVNSLRVITSTLPLRQPGNKGALQPSLNIDDQVVVLRT